MALIQATPTATLVGPSQLNQRQRFDAACSCRPSAASSVRSRTAVRSEAVAPLAQLTRPQLRRHHRRGRLTVAATAVPGASSASGLPSDAGSCLVQTRGWEVKMLDPREMILAAELQTRAFFQPGAIQALDAFFLYLMRGELVDTLKSKLKYTTANKFAALVVRRAGEAAAPIAGVVEVSVQRDPEVARTLGVTEYAYVACMAVEKEHRRRGAASALLSGAEAIGRRWGFREAALHVYVHNEGGKKLYAANGWVERKTDATLPAMLMGKKQRILMSKSLVPPTAAPAPSQATTGGASDTASS